MKSVATVFFLLLILDGCKKPVDYRDKFLGNYTFTVHYTAYWGLPPNLGSIDTLYTYNGRVSLGSQEKAVLIYFSDKATIEPFIYEDGTWGLYSVFLGEFASTSTVKFHASYYTAGTSSNYDVTGEKK